MKSKIMKRAIFFIGCVFIISTSYSCCDGPKGHYSLKIINNSDMPIYFLDGRNYPDTTLLDYNPALSPITFKINNNSFKNRNYRDPIELNFKHSSSDKIIYFLFNAKTVETVPWDTVMKKYLILRRYELTLQDLKKMNWTLTYP